MEGRERLVKDLTTSWSLKLYLSQLFAEVSLFSHFLNRYNISHDIFLSMFV